MQSRKGVVVISQKLEDRGHLEQRHYDGACLREVRVVFVVAYCFIGGAGLLRTGKIGEEGGGELTFL